MTGIGDAMHIIKYLKLKYGLSLLKIHEKYKKYIFRIIFYVSLIKNDKQTKKGKDFLYFSCIFRSERPYFNFKYFILQ
jgi:hypothetical protein